MPYHPDRHARIVAPNPSPSSNPSFAPSHPVQLQSQPCPSAALGGQSGSPNGHLERIRDSIDHVEWMRWSTRYGRAMLAEKRGQNAPPTASGPLLPPEAGPPRHFPLSNFNGHYSKISSNSLTRRNFIWTGIPPRTVDRDLYVSMSCSSLYALFIQNLAVSGQEASILRGPTS